MLDQMTEVFAKQEAFVSALKEQEITNENAHDLMMKVVREGAFPVSKLLKVAEAWDIERGAPVRVRGGDEPHTRFGYSESGETAWDLLNAFTFVNRERSAENQIDGSAALTKVFERELQLQI
jgi:hypothetical protein